LGTIPLKVCKSSKVMLHLGKVIERKRKEECALDMVENNARWNNLKHTCIFVSFTQKQ
jgi:hypothetical protein